MVITRVVTQRTAMGRSELLAEIAALERSDRHWRARVDELQARCTELLLEVRAHKRAAMESRLLADSLRIDNDGLRVSRAMMSQIVRNSGRAAGCCPGCLESIPPPAPGGTSPSGQAPETA